MGLSSHKEAIVDALAAGLVGPDLVRVIAPNEEPLSFEFDLYDCKETISDEKVSYAELAKDVIAFHNSYGGYLVIGIKETSKDGGFSVAGFEGEERVAQKLKSALDSYSSERISFHVVSLALKSTPILAIFVPKRSELEQPVFTVRNGPDKKPGCPVFLEKTVFFRKKDECLKASIPPHWEFLNSSRDAARLLSSPSKVSPANAVARVVPNNLPDRNLICT